MHPWAHPHLRLLGRYADMPLIHPATVHFPIALLLTNGLLTIIYLRRPSAALELSAYYCLSLGWLGAVVATLSGVLAAADQVFGPNAPHRASLPWVNAHAIIGIATLFVYGQALLRRRRNPALLDTPASRNPYLVLLALGALLVVGGGWFGGFLVYELGVGVR